MRLQPIVYTTDMAETVGWYRTVLGLDPVYTSDMWTAFAVGDATLGIHAVQEPAGEGGVALSLVATEPLEQIESRLAGAGVIPETGIQDETFGRSLLLRDPVGNAVQVNEHGSP